MLCWCIVGAGGALGFQVPGPSLFAGELSKAADRAVWGLGTEHASARPLGARGVDLWGNPVLYQRLPQHSPSDPLLALVLLRRPPSL